MAGHKSIKRIAHRFIEELDATRRIAKVTSFKEGLETFRAKIDIQIMNRNGYYEKTFEGVFFTKSNPKIKQNDDGYAIDKNILLLI